nr:hypothetical protein [Tanacetum cinerariifolium]
MKLIVILRKPFVLSRDCCMITHLLIHQKIFSENSNAEIDSFSPSPIPVEDSDSFMEESDISFTLDDPMLSGIEEDDDDSERNTLILEELLDNYSLSLPENESFHFDIPSFSRPPAKPPDEQAQQAQRMVHFQVKENQEKDRIETKPDKKGKRGAYDDGETLYDDDNISEGEGLDLYQLDLLLQENDNEDITKVGQSVRRSSRKIVLPSKFKDYVIDGKSFKEVVLDSKWIDAMNFEIEVLNRNNTWVVTDLPKGRRPVGCCYSLPPLKEISTRDLVGCGSDV